MKVRFVGTGNAFASGGRNHLAILLEGRSAGVLLDCGPTTLSAMKRLGLSPALVDTVVLSHLHGDHFAGVPFLVLHEIYEGGRQEPLRVLGPPGAERALRDLTALLYPGLSEPEFELSIRELRPGRAETVGALRVYPFEVDHFSRGVALGFRVELDGKTIVYSGDTGWNDDLVEQSKDADLFICECSTYESALERHVSHRELAASRERLGARRIVLVHPGDDVLSRESELLFELAHDGMEVSL